MNDLFEILPLRPFTQDEVWPIVSGYETQEIYTVEKTETDPHIFFDIRLVRIDPPFRDSFYNDFTPDEREWHHRLIPKGCCFGAYAGGRLTGITIGEALPEDRLLRVWEFHVHPDFRRMGIGRALMERVIAKAREERLPALMLETQNTNVPAIRFYRRMGFRLESIDLSPPHYPQTGSQAIRQAAFYMKRPMDGN
jgi:streptothricin acetyltransferase